MLLKKFLAIKPNIDYYNYLYFILVLNKLLKDNKYNFHIQSYKSYKIYASDFYYDRTVHIDNYKYIQKFYVNCYIIDETRESIMIKFPTYVLVDCIKSVFSSKECVLKKLGIKNKTWL